jgi:hypothetical protein
MYNKMFIMLKCRETTLGRVCYILLGGRSCLLFRWWCVLVIRVVCVCAVSLIL